MNNYNNYNNNLNQNNIKSPYGLYSLIAGIISCILCPVYYIGIPCGVCAIVFSILFKNSTGKSETRSSVGLGLGIAGIMLALFIFFIMLSVIRNPELMNFILENADMNNLEFY